MQKTSTHQLFMLCRSLAVPSLTSTLVLGINCFVIMTRPLHPIQVTLLLSKSFTYSHVSLFVKISSLSTIHLS